MEKYISDRMKCLSQSFSNAINEIERLEKENAELKKQIEELKSQKLCINDRFCVHITGEL